MAVLNIQYGFAIIGNNATVAKHKIEFSSEPTHFYLNQPFIPSISITVDGNPLDAIEGNLYVILYYMR